MADPRLQPAPQSQPQPEETDAGHVPLTEEFDKAKWTMPPIGVVVIALAVIAVIVGLISYGMRPKPGATGSIDEAYAVALPGDNVLATVKVTLRNTGGKPLFIRNIKAQINTDKGEFKDEAANAVDFDRYFRGYPDLRDHSILPLKVETRLSPGEQIRGSVIVSFPITVDTFNNRKSLSVVIEPYDMAPVAIQK